MATYSEKLANPLWQRKRLEIMNRDNWKCQSCGRGDLQLEIHHTQYFEGRQPWEYDSGSLVTLCHDCHEKEKERPKHEEYLLRSLTSSGFAAMDILAFSTLLDIDKNFCQELKDTVREFINGKRLIKK